eukprot:8991422-Alexandrium_andersonii.AAC.1
MLAREVRASCKGMSLPRIWRKAKKPGKLGWMRGSLSILRMAATLNAQGTCANKVIHAVTRMMPHAACRTP